MVRRFKGPDQVLVHVGETPRFFAPDEVVPDEVLELIEDLDRVTYDPDAPAPADDEDGGNGQDPEGGAGAAGGAGAPQGWDELDGSVKAISGWVAAAQDSQTTLQRAQFALDQELAKGDDQRKTLVAELQTTLGL
jgi:hypothetical protein